MGCYLQFEIHIFVFDDGISGIIQKWNGHLGSLTDLGGLVVQGQHLGGRNDFDLACGFRGQKGCRYI